MLLKRWRTARFKPLIIELGLVLPGSVSQKAGQADKKIGTGACKLGHENTVYPMKVEPVYKGILS